MSKLTPVGSVDIWLFLPVLPFVRVESSLLSSSVHHVCLPCHPLPMQAAGNHRLHRSVEILSQQLFSEGWHIKNKGSKGAEFMQHEKEDKRRKNTQKLQSLCYSDFFVGALYTPLMDLVISSIDFFFFFSKLLQKTHRLLLNLRREF